MSLLPSNAVEYIEKHKLTQHAASERMGVPRSRISNAIAGKLDSFTIDMLVSMLERVGVSPLREAGSLNSFTRAQIIVCERSQSR